jgi:hypothetical protein
MRNGGSFIYHDFWLFLSRFKLEQDLIISIDLNLLFIGYSP